MPSPTHSFFRRIAIGWLPIFVAFLLGGAMAGCSTGSGGETAHATMAPTATAHADGGSGASGGGSVPGLMGGMHTAEQAQAAWDARPAFVKDAGPRTVEAYAYALSRGDVLQWMPCYCGCVAMNHRNNLDCYFKPHSAGSLPQFDEHASYCKVCVDIALRAKGMQADGKSLVEIRAAVDTEFGANAPGTKTAMPPRGS